MSVGRKNRPILCALTGGPCGGKTTSLQLLRKALMDANYNCFTVPEVYTVLMNNGCEAVYPNNYTDISNRTRAIDCLSRELLFQIRTEDNFIDYASLSDKPVVIICDRGALDIAAYAGDDLFNLMLDSLKLSRDSLLKRYDIVIHLVTTAVGAELFYSNETNDVRKETIEEARELDAVTRKGWQGHHNMHIIGNGEGGFEQKLKLINSCVFDHLASLSNAVVSSEVDNV